MRNEWELYQEPQLELITRNHEHPNEHEQLVRETLAEALTNLADQLMRKGE